jgi:hypothetical protein
VLSQQLPGALEDLGPDRERVLLGQGGFLRLQVRFVFVLVDVDTALEEVVDLVLVFQHEALAKQEVAGFGPDVPGQGFVEPDLLCTQAQEFHVGGLRQDSWPISDKKPS